MIYPASLGAARIPWNRILPTELFSVCRSRFVQTIPEARNTKGYYVTTPIFYPNTDPHVGHLHSIVIADVFRRYQALRHNRPFGLYVTGTDEHGLKIQRVAEATGQTPIELCDKVSQNFKALAIAAGVGTHRFIRTTEEKHRVAVEHLWRTLSEKGHIYKGTYAGWYSVSDEAYYTESQVHDTFDEGSGDMLKASIESGSRVEWVEEENYKFRLSTFREPLIEWLQTNPNAVQPPSRQASLLESLKAGPLADLSISRPASRLKWGIPVPEDEEHTIYVWIDALTNYLTATGYPWIDRPNLAWPADLQVIGKDILRFHAIYWPAILIACDLPLPKTILTHAHWTMGKFKMSKSRGNVADPNELLGIVGVDGVRWYLMRNGGNFEDDSDYSLARVIDTYNIELRGQLGNLLQRIRNPKIIRGLSPDLIFEQPEEVMDGETEIHNCLVQLPDVYHQHMDAFQPGRAMQAVANAIREANKHIANLKPWRAEATQPEVHSALFYVQEALRIVSYCINPVMPRASSTIRSTLGLPAVQSGENLSIGGGEAGLVRPSSLVKGQGILFKPLLEGEKPEIDGSENQRRHAKSPLQKYRSLEDKIKLGDAPRTR